MAAIDVREVPYPVQHKDAECQRAFEIACESCHLGVMYAHEPYQSGGRMGVHVSISKSIAGRPSIVKASDIAIVERVIGAHKLRWPRDYETDRFQGGPFKNKGLHLWETLDAALAALEQAGVKCEDTE